MLEISQLLAAVRDDPQSARLSSTGIPGLDEVTGGLKSGQIWVLVGGAGEGKTALLTQWVVALAQGGHPVQLVCPREPAAWVAGRMLAQLGRIPLPHLIADRSGAPDPGALHRASEALEGLPIAMSVQDGPPFTPETEPYSAAERPAAVVLDDADLIGGVTPARVARYAADGLLVVVSLPRERVLAGDGDFAPLIPAWTRTADVVLEVRQRTRGSVSDPTAPGGLRGPDLRPGEGDLVVHRNRWGPTRTIPVRFQGHFARFVPVEG